MKFGEMRDFLKKTNNRPITKEMIRRRMDVDKELRTHRNLFYASAVECLLSGLSVTGVIGSVSQYVGGFFGVEIDYGTAYALDAAVTLSGFANMNYRIRKLSEPIENRIIEGLF